MYTYLYTVIWHGYIISTVSHPTVSDSIQTQWDKPISEKVVLIPISSLHQGSEFAGLVFAFCDPQTDYPLCRLLPEAVDNVIEAVVYHR